VVSSLAASAAPAFADSLNPLTKRSLTLSSSSPGWSYSDGSGNTTYAPPNSGANGKQTGNTFEFNTSSDSSTTAIKTMSFQYCTTSAGYCQSPGNDWAATVAGTDDASHSDLNVVTSTPAPIASTDFGTVVNTSTGAVKAVPGATNPANPSDTTGQFAAHGVAGNFVVYYNNAGTWTYSPNWTMTTLNAEDTGNVTHPSGKQNYIVLANTGTGATTPADTTFKVVFFGTSTNYITNPGDGAFFVKINTYKVAYDGTTVTASDLAPTTNTNVIDGGVTVANVMNQSIQITTKVLETMQFSVGTVDPNTLSSSDGGASTQSAFEKAMGYAADNNAKKHTPCDPIVMSLDSTNPAKNVLKLGDQSAESSLSDTDTYTTHSYWRLSSNSSAGATVYYSGHTLSNTEGDQIKPIGSSAATPGDGLKAAPQAGSEQFGLALDASASAPYTTAYDWDATNHENGEDILSGGTKLTGVDSSTTTDVGSNASWHTPQLAPLVPQSNYADGGAGTSGAVNGSSTAKFAFDSTSDTIPVALATESSQVVDCVTARMRYMANIAATTPAGIYTTKINYIAAPQY